MSQGFFFFKYFRGFQTKLLINYIINRAIAEYLSRDIPYTLKTDDVLFTVGAKHAIHVLLTALSCPGANILFPRPNYPTYEARARFSSQHMHKL